VELIATIAKLAEHAAEVSQFRLRDVVFITRSPRQLPLRLTEGAHCRVSYPRKNLMGRRPRIFRVTGKTFLFVKGSIDAPVKQL
jgi:hypothetical protein